MSCNVLLSFQNWKKFGNSEFDAPGPNVATTTVSDDVFMTFISSKEVHCVFLSFFAAVHVVECFNITSVKLWFLFSFLLTTSS